jgi:hypothetical protein
MKNSDDNISHLKHQSYTLLLITLSLVVVVVEALVMVVAAVVVGTFLEQQALPQPPTPLLLEVEEQK